MDVLCFLRINIKPMKYKVTGLESVACGLENQRFSRSTLYYKDYKNDVDADGCYYNNYELVSCHNSGRFLPLKPYSSTTPYIIYIKVSQSFIFCSLSSAFSPIVYSPHVKHPQPQRCILFSYVPC